MRQLQQLQQLQYCNSLKCSVLIVLVINQLGLERQWNH